MIVEVFDQCQYYGMDGPDGSIHSTGLNQSHLAAICSSPNTFVHTRKRRVEELARGCFSIFVSQINAPKQVVNPTTAAASSTFCKRALRSFFWLLCQKLSKTNKEKL